MALAHCNLHGVAPLIALILGSGVWEPAADGTRAPLRDRLSSHALLVVLASPAPFPCVRAAELH